MSLHLHLSVHLLHNSFLVNQEGGSFCAQKSSAIEAFLLPHSIEIQDLSFGVAEQSEGQLMFLLEFPVRLDAVFAHSQYDHVSFSNSLIVSLDSMASLVHPGVPSFG